MSACLISDLHLQVERPDLTFAFEKFIKDKASSYESLYILGDLFEAWIGDDFDNEFTIQIKKILSYLTSLKVNLYLMHGNRDFLIGKSFCEDVGANLIDDPSKVIICNKEVLLMHGDTLCIDDVDYQTFRSVVRDSKWKKEFLKKDINERIEVAKSLRDVSKIENKDKSLKIMDVNQIAVNDVFQKNNVSLLIHGHTHRPQEHNEVYGKRFVLGDWDKDLWYLTITNKKIELIKETI
jgi:UDP-2,3-diacylglucosamine hydrolase